MVVDFLSLLLVVFGCISCSQEEVVPADDKAYLLYDSIPAAHVVVPMIREASGLVDSKTVSKHLWVHEDSGNQPQLYLLGHDGKVQKTVQLKGIVNRDWEEMSRLGSDLFIAETGDNLLRYESYAFYQFAEPGASTDTVRDIRTIRFVYEDGPHDAEAFLIDPQSKDIFIITKRDTPSLIFKLAAPYSYSELNTARKVGELPFSGVVGAALSPDGSEILLKTYPNVHHYSRSKGQSIADALRQEARLLPYRLEPQGEAVAFSNARDGFFTLSEKGFGTVVNLHFYRRNP
ncbi:hypothetical protein [Cesiribacter andamanensis]|nr:hypothetical protein [Cesiribacter andamanensis]